MNISFSTSSPTESLLKALTKFVKIKKIVHSFRPETEIFEVMGNASVLRSDDFWVKLAKPLGWNPMYNKFLVPHGPLLQLRYFGAEDEGPHYSARYNKLDGLFTLGPL